jgi:hypothetical protein
MEVFMPRALVALAILSGCGGPVEPSESVAPVTFQADVRPLLDRHCVACHSEGAIGPFALDDVDVALSVREAIVMSVQDRSMPPWGMDPDCHPTVGNLRLSDADVAVFSGWKSGGFEVGDVADYVPNLPVAQQPLPEPDIVLSPPAAYTPSRASIDDYRCLPVAEPIDRDLFVTGVDVIPGNLSMVHHVLLYAIPPGAQAELEALDALDEEAGYTCFGTSGLDNAQTVGGWVPGNSPAYYGEGIAQRIPAGSKLVMQMHYNTAAGEGSDRSTVHLWTLPQGEVPEQLMTVFPLPKLSLDIQAGDAHSVQVARQRLPIPEGSKVFATSPHMHLLGTSLSSKIIRADGSEQCLSKVDAWDFNWQRSYGIPEADRIPFSVHDEVEITCTYDNSAANQASIDGTPREPADVTWGDGSFDEMCLDYLAMVRPYEGDGTGGTCAEYDTCHADCEPGDGVCAMSCMTGSGESCLFCGLDGLFGNCVGFACAVPGLALQSCMADCAPSYEDQFACLYDGCREAFDAYMDCAQPVLDSSSCIDAFEGCEDIADGLN